MYRDERVTDAMVEEMTRYALRYGGRCRDCADVDGFCRDGQPCDYPSRVAVTKHTIRALAYGFQHGFLNNPFSAALSEQTLPKPVAWYVKDYADGWIHFDNEADAIRQQEATGAMMHVAFPAYAHPPRSALVDNSHASKVVVEKLREALEAARAWIDIVRGSCGGVEMPSWDNRDPSQIERETFALIDAALSASLRPAEVGSATDTTGTGGGE